MPIDRKPVEDYFAEQRRKMEEAMGPAVGEAKIKVLEVLSQEPERLYSIQELAEKVELAESCCEDEGCKGCSGCPRHLEPALRILLTEGKIVAYPWPLPPTEETQFYFGIKK